MKALIVEKPNQAVIRDVPVPAVGESDVLIKVRFSGICGTDLAIYSGQSSFVETGLIRYPIRIGHEWSGIVEKAGRQAAGFRPGDPVVSDNAVSCGVCEHCLAGRYDDCPTTRAVGTINCWDGSFAEYMLMPARHVHHLPEQMNLENAALFEPASIACGGVNQCRLGPGSSVAVIGTGAIGLSAVAIARHKGAEQVVLVGRNAAKLEIGRQMGATEIINIREQDPIARMRQICGGTGVQHILETSGDLASVKLSLQLACKKGLIALISFYEKPVSDLQIDDIVSRELRIVGIMGSFAAMRDTLQLMTREQIDLTPMITRRYAFADCLEAFAESGRMTDRIKLMVHFP